MQKGRLHLPLPCGIEGLICGDSRSSGPITEVITHRSVRRLRPFDRMKAALALRPTRAHPMAN